MNGSYAETCIKRKVTFGTVALKAFIIIGVALLAGILLTINSGGSGGAYILSLLAAGLIVALIVILPMFNVDYEYIYCDGQIDFDQISGGSRRKNKLRIDLDNIEIMAPENSRQLDSYRNRTQVKTKDFSSRDKEAKRFIVYMNSEEGNKRIIFEPSEKMLELARQKSPRKVYMD